MSHTVSTDKHEDEYTEYVDSESSRAQKIDLLCELVKKHKGSTIVFTGAGISTAAGIPDFRSGLDSATGLPAGKWAVRATRADWSEAEQEAQADAQKRTAATTLSAIPSASHMALVALEREGYIAGLISQNCDGLHCWSGFPPNKHAEVHGNCNVEYCVWCGAEYLRDYKAARGRKTAGRALKE